jgi:polar amino acid transport system permease protein
MDYQLDFTGILPYYKDILNGILLTIEITAATTILGVVAGTIGAACRVGKNRFLQNLIGGFVEVIRNTPFIVQLFFIFFGLPALGIKLTALEAGMIAMVVNLGAYSTEIIRAGVEATSKGQWEAGKTLGLRWSQIFIHIVLPQALSKVSPALISQCIIVMLGSAVLSQISVEELTFTANFIQSRTFLSFESYFIITLVYLVLSILLRYILTFVSKKFFNMQSID